MMTAVPNWSEALFASRKNQMNNQNNNDATPSRTTVRIPTDSGD